MNHPHRQPRILAIVAAVLLLLLMPASPAAAAPQPSMAAIAQPADGLAAGPGLAARQPAPAEPPEQAVVSGRDGIVVEVVEHLRLQVPAEARQAWLIAERECWDPWLRQQSGFLGRDLYWDAEREEGVLLIRWATQQAWDAIPTAEIDAVQRRFEARARGLLSGDERSNPFPLLESGSLAPMGRT